MKLTMHTQRCRYLLVYNTISTQEYHSITQHTAKALCLTNYDIDHTGLRSFTVYLTTQVIIQEEGHTFSFNGLSWTDRYTLFKKNRSNSSDQLPVTNVYKKYENPSPTNEITLIGTKLWKPIMYIKQILTGIHDYITYFSVSVFITDG